MCKYLGNLLAVPTWKHGVMRVVWSPQSDDLYIPYADLLIFSTLFYKD